MADRQDTSRYPIPLSGERVTFTGTAGTNTNGAPANTSAIGLLLTQAAHVRVSKNGDVATTSDPAVPANVLHFIAAGPTMRVSMVKTTDSTDGAGYTSAWS